MDLISATDWHSAELHDLDWGDQSPPSSALAPERVLVVVDGSSGRVLARCALWWQDTPPAGEAIPGVVGQFWSCDQGASTMLLAHACEMLARQGCRLALGPMDRNTWHAHRLVTWSDGTAPFPLEPEQPAAWVQHWQAAGFVPTWHYHSSAAVPTPGDDPRSERIRARMQAQGMQLRPLQKDRFEQELAAIHQLSLQSFRRNLLYQPQSWDTFRQQYQPLKALHEPRATVVAEDHHGLAGFLFAYPAPSVTADGASRLVLKTIAVRPGRDCAGLGLLLADHAYQAACEAGYGEVIHALMQDSNRSALMRSETARVFRRYALFSRRLDQTTRRSSGGLS
ncbi:hypothetical protein E4656_03565 [Natronospirillum operosum]|uniref:N-acetyltransferase domain-containing protein n=1 Tax=Natronospirillum operosum TaxID=2759953 RepID=A0A4Z0WA51_9GAMM|nr:hypothetical protein [Natronospirillum operosum]TGG95509.1 hypothetical protein E4656_03565 [Natronospirillum operosum]